jgi:acyl-CoA synthetase (AMP-forming)/AMP-acid ligase II
MAEGLSEWVRATLEKGGEAPAIAFGGTWRDWAWVRHVAGQLDAALEAGGVAKDAPVALIARNRPAQVAAFAGQIAAHRPTSMVYSAQTPVGLAADVAKLACAAVLADPQDWTPELTAAARQAGAFGLALVDDPETPVRPVEGLERAGPGPHRSLAPQIAFELLSSGTTGAPKRVPLAWSTVESATADAGVVYAGTSQRQAPLLMLHPMGNVAGISYLCPPLAAGQPIVLLEKFTVDGWADAVATYRPVRSSLPPAAVRMVMEAKVPREKLASLQVLAVGGARIEPELQEAFEQAYGIPVTTAFGATEFGGVVANWTLDLYRQYGAAKRGSAGRASPKVALRVVDRETLSPLPAGEVGLLEAKVDRLGPDWIRTTDLARLDEDGFLFLHGRADDAINRGGFKIVPEVVASVLRQHPAVADAAVVGLPDPRLGEVPAAAVELKPDAPAPTPADLLAFARDRLVAYQVPVALKIVPTLPRTLSMKVSAPDVKALF